MTGEINDDTYIYQTKTVDIEFTLQQEPLCVKEPVVLPTITGTDFVYNVFQLTNLEIPLPGASLNTCAFLHSLTISPSLNNKLYYIG